MSKILIVPGLAVGREHFERVAAALAEHAEYPGVTWEQFIDPASWARIPGPDGQVFKIEFAFARSTERTGKVNFWLAPDYSGGSGPEPHQHPWAEINSHILVGGYEEGRFTAQAGSVSHEIRTHGAGEVNSMLVSDYHQVTAVEPGTLTLMLCGRHTGQRWGYLDVETGRFRPNPPELHAAFLRRYEAANPHLR